MRGVRRGGRTVQDQQLMFGQNGFRHDSADTSGPDHPENRRDEVHNENNQITHEQWYTAARKPPNSELIWNSP